MDRTSDTPMEQPARSRWKARLIVSLIMLLLAFLSLFIMKISPRVYWIFAYLMGGIDAILCIGLVAYLKRINETAFVGNLWHMILHWIGLMVVMYLITLFIERGIITPTEAGLFALILLALTLYLAGIYTDSIFILIGITFALMAAGMLLIPGYLWLVMIPVMVVVALIILAIVTRDRRQTQGS